MVDNPKASDIIDIWKKIVEVQMHFNVMSMRIRNFVVLLMGAFLASSGVALDKGTRISAFGVEVSLAFWLTICAIFVVGCFFILDYFWFNRLLSGAVHHGEYIEQKYKDQLPEIALAIKIREKDENTKILRFNFSAKRKLGTFYILLFMMLTVAAFVFFNA